MNYLSPDVFLHFPKTVNYLYAVPLINDKYRKVYLTEDRSAPVQIRMNASPSAVDAYIKTRYKMSLDVYILSPDRDIPNMWNMLIFVQPPYNTKGLLKYDYNNVFRKKNSNDQIKVQPEPFGYFVYLMRLYPTPFEPKYIITERFTQVYDRNPMIVSADEMINFPFFISRTSLLPYDTSRVLLGVKTVSKLLTDIGGGCSTGIIEDPITCMTREVREEIATSVDIQHVLNNSMVFMYPFERSTWGAMLLYKVSKQDMDTMVKEGRADNNELSSIELVSFDDLMTIPLSSFEAYTFERIMTILRTQFDYKVLFQLT